MKHFINLSCARAQCVKPEKMSVSWGCVCDVGCLVKYDELAREVSELSIKATCVTVTFGSNQSGGYFQNVAPPTGITET